MQRALSIIRAFQLGLSIGLSIILTLILSLLIGSRLPNGSGISFPLFNYGDETVGISLLGGFAPVFFSLGMLLSLSGVHGQNHTKPLRGPIPWVTVLGLGILFTLIFSISHDWFSGLSLSESWAIWLASFGAGLGILLRFVRAGLGVAAAGLEMYAIGTLGTFSSDVIRTLTFLGTAPGEALVWGGDGLRDLVLWFGVYMVLGYLFFELISIIFTKSLGVKLIPSDPLHDARK